MKTICVSYKAVLILLTLFIALTLPSRSESQTYAHIYVDAVNGTNAPTGRGSTANPYKSITYALLISGRSNLSDPWHVHIRPGTYDADPGKPAIEREVFPINLRSGMIFEGTTTAEACVVDAQHLGESEVPILRGENTGNVLIRNLTIQNMNGTGIILNDASGASGTPSTLEACIVHNNARGGVWANISLLLTGNTISNNGGESGVKIEGDSTADISKNTFQNGGLHVTGVLKANITHNIFTGNGNNWPYRGGFYVSNLTGNVTYNTFTDNRANGGGGFSVDKLTGNVTHNIFTGNTATDGNDDSRNGGGGFNVRELTGNVTHNTFTNNKGQQDGGAFRVRWLIGDVTHNIFTGNTSGRYGGGVEISVSTTSNITHNIFTGNSSANGYGGALDIGKGGGERKNMKISNNIFLNNTIRAEDSGPSGSAVFAGKAVMARFLNNLFVTEGVDSSSATVWVELPDCRFHNNIFSGMQTAIYTKGIFDLRITHNIFHDIKQDIVNQGGAGVGNDVDFWELLSNNASDNLSVNPQFIGPATRDFQLRSTSPAINAGTNAFAPTDDFAGVNRPIGGRVDIGPYEFGGTPRPSTPARFIFNLPTSVEAGKRFTADLTMEDAEHVAGISLTLHFNPGVLEVKDVQEGDFLLGDGTATPFFQVESIDNVRGMLSGVKLTRNVDKTTGGVLLKVIFEAKATGVSSLEVRDVKLGNAAGQSIPVESTAGKVEVTPLPEAPEVTVSVDPDVDGNGVVNILDLVMVSRHFGAASDAPAGVDVNKDGGVDILDLILVSQHL